MNQFNKDTLVFLLVGLLLLFGALVIDKRNQWPKEEPLYPDYLRGM